MIGKVPGMAGRHAVAQTTIDLRVTATQIHGDPPVPSSFLLTTTTVPTAAMGFFFRSVVHSRYTLGACGSLALLLS